VPERSERQAKFSLRIAERPVPGLALTPRDCCPAAYPGSELKMRDGIHGEGPRSNPASNGLRCGLSALRGHGRRHVMRTDMISPAQVRRQELDRRR